MSPLSSEQIRRGMRLSIADGVAVQLFYGLTWPGSVFITGLALLLGANNFEVGLLAALPSLLSGVNLLAARMLERAGRRRRFFAVSALVHRLVFAALLAFPLAAGFVAARTLLAVLVAVVLVSTFFGGFMHTSWMSWMADMVPEGIRGAFFSRRSMVCGAVWMGQAYLLGRILTAHNTVTAYALAFGGAALLAAAAIPIVTAQPEPPLDVTERRPSLVELWRGAWSRRGFRYFLIFQLCWGFTTALAGPFYNVYMLRSLGIDVGAITVWGIVGGVVSTLTILYWGTLGDRGGNKPVLLFSLIGSCTAAFGWLLVTRANAHWLILTLFAVGGFFDTGVGLIAFNTLLGVLPEKNKPSSIALYDTVVGTVVGIAPLAGGWLAETLPQTTVVPGVPMDPVLGLIAISTVLRVFPLALIVRMPPQRGRSFGFVMREFVLTNPLKLLPNLQFVGKSPTQKISAIETLSDMRSKAALPDLIRAIHDLNPRVRQRAVQALGAIGDSEALGPLVEALDDPLQDIQGEAALALGRLGDQRAVPHLLAKLASSDQHLQRCAATALGDLRASEATEALVRLMRATGSNAVMLACADALGRIGDFRAVEPLLEITRLAANKPVKHSLVAGAGLLVNTAGELYKALSEPEVHASRDAPEILSTSVVRMARGPLLSLRRELEEARQAFGRGSYNDAILHMKKINQMCVREYLASGALKTVLGFEPWVKLLDSDFATQLQAMQRIDPATGMGLAIVDYYARHCPSPSEPDMDLQEFLLALYAFKSAQEGLSRLALGRNVVVEKLQESLKGLLVLLDVR